MEKKNKNMPEELLERQLWKTTDKLYKNADVAEYKNIKLATKTNYK